MKGNFSSVEILEQAQKTCRNQMINRKYVV